jgi:hypothetical protein
VEVYFLRVRLFHRLPLNIKNLILYSYGSSQKCDVFLFFLNYFFLGAFLGHGIDLYLEIPQVTEKLV